MNVTRWAWHSARSCSTPWSMAEALIERTTWTSSMFGRTVWFPAVSRIRDRDSPLTRSPRYFVGGLFNHLRGQLAHSSCNDDVTIRCSHCSFRDLRGSYSTTCAL